VQQNMKKIHFVGIGGVGMSGIAKVLLELGYHVTGSDLKQSELTNKLSNLGAKIYQGHAAENIDGADVVVVSSAIQKTNPEVKAAQEKQIPIWQRAQMLAFLMARQKGIAVAGAHGKTTTSSMIATILEKSGYDPSLVIGGVVNNMGFNAKLGQGEYLVAEADESDGSMLLLDPVITVVTNIEDDHLDHYGSMENIIAAFKKFINKLPKQGFALLCADNAQIREIKDELKVKVITYGVENQADYLAKKIKMVNLASSFEVWCKGKLLGEISLLVPGLHNVYNALAAVVVCLEEGLSFAQIKQALASFGGVQRRFQIVGRSLDVLVVDDYAHHPTEIKAALQAARDSWQGRVIAIFQPHRYTRTKLLEKEFAKAFSAAHLIILNEIYSAGEQPIPGVTAEKLCLSIEEHEGRKVKLLSDKEELVEYLLTIVKPGDLVMTIGAGDIWQVGQHLSARLAQSIED